jgi:hypothetical protein
MRLAPWIFSAVFILSVGQGVQGDDCPQWFKNSGISSAEKSCLTKCSSLVTDLGTFDCPNRCQEFCNTKKKYKCEPNKSWDKLLRDGRPLEWPHKKEQFSPWTKKDRERLSKVFSSKPKWSFENLNNITLGMSSSELQKKWGEPSSKTPTDIEGVQFVEWIYKPNDETSIQFLIDPNSNQVVEKIHFPSPLSSEANLDFLVNKQFENIKLEKVRPKCARHGAIAYVNRDAGLVIATQEGDKIPVAGVIWTTPKVFELREKEDQNRKCTW